MMGLALAPTPALINIDKTSFYKFSFKEYQFLNICNYKKSETKKSFFLKVSWMSTLNEDSVIYEESKKPSVDHNASTHSYFKHMNHHCMSCITRDFAFIMLWFKGSIKYMFWTDLMGAMHQASGRLSLGNFIPLSSPGMYMNSV